MPSVSIRRRKDGLFPSSTLTAEDREALLAPADPRQPNGPNLFESMKCAHCGGAHRRACPRVRRMDFEYKGEITQIKSVEFWPEGQWSDDNIIWPEDVYLDDGSLSES